MLKGPPGQDGPNGVPGDRGPPVSAINLLRMFFFFLMGL